MTAVTATILVRFSFVAEPGRESGLPCGPLEVGGTGVVVKRDVQEYSASRGVDAVPWVESLWISVKGQRELPSWDGDVHALTSLDADEGGVVLSDDSGEAAVLEPSHHAVLDEVVTELEPSGAASAVAACQRLPSTAGFAAAGGLQDRPLLTNRPATRLPELVGRKAPLGVKGGENCQKGHRSNMCLTVGTRLSGQAFVAVDDARHRSVITALLRLLKATVQASLVPCAVPRERGVSVLSPRRHGEEVRHECLSRPLLILGPVQPCRWHSRFPQLLPRDVRFMELEK
jgi:hypothetical protein